MHLRLQQGAGVSVSTSLFLLLKPSTGPHSLLLPPAFHSRSRTDGAYIPAVRTPPGHELRLSGPLSGQVNSVSIQRPV